jgi:hypothetical protein
VKIVNPEIRLWQQKKSLLHPKIYDTLTKLSPEPLNLVGPGGVGDITNTMQPTRVRALAELCHGRVCHVPTQRTDGDKQSRVTEARPT